MEIRVQFPRERAGPSGSVRKVRPVAGHEIDPGEQTDDRRQNDPHQDAPRQDDRREGEGREHQPSPDADIGGHVDKIV